MKPSQEENKRLNKRLQEFRKKANIQQQEMADYCGLSKNYLSAMERGINKCNAHVLINYARKLNISLDELTGFQKTTSQEENYELLPELKKRLQTMDLKTQEKLLKIIDILNE